MIQLETYEHNSGDQVESKKDTTVTGGPYQRVQTVLVLYFRHLRGLYDYEKSNRPFYHSASNGNPSQIED
jgi:hypothetical protein